MEKTNRAWIYPVRFGWCDIGTWESLYNHFEDKDSQGNAIKTEICLLEDTKEVMAISTNPKKLIAIKGLENYMVVDTEDALIICPKDDKNFRDFISGIAMPEYEKYR